jgi:hypothetical protein
MNNETFPPCRKFSANLTETSRYGREPAPKAFDMDTFGVF